MKQLSDSDKLDAYNKGHRLFASKLSDQMEIICHDARHNCKQKGNFTVAICRKPPPESSFTRTIRAEFCKSCSYGSGGYTSLSVALADVNGDGKPDLIVANICVSSGSCGNGTVSVLLGNGDGTFKTAVSYSSGGYYASAVAVADVNGDGIPDLLVANQCASTCSGSSPVVGSVGVLLGNGDGTFHPWSDLPHCWLFRDGASGR